jgi:hypothetical protein
MTITPAGRCFERQAIAAPFKTLPPVYASVSTRSGQSIEVSLDREPE